MQHHKEVWDTIYDLAVMAWHQTTKETVIGESNENSSGALLRGHIGVRGVWQTQMTLLFGVRVIDTGTESYVVCAPQSVLENAEKEKKSKYLHVVVCEESMSVSPRSVFRG